VSCQGARAGLGPIWGNGGAPRRREGFVPALSSAFGQHFPLSGFFLGRVTASVMPSVEVENFVDRAEDKTQNTKTSLIWGLPNSTRLAEPVDLQRSRICCGSFDGSFLGGWRRASGPRSKCSILGRSQKIKQKQKQKTFRRVQSAPERRSSANKQEKNLARLNLLSPPRAEARERPWRQRTTFT